MKLLKEFESLKSKIEARVEEIDAQIAELRRERATLVRGPSPEVSSESDHGTRIPRCVALVASGVKTRKGLLKEFGAGSDAVATRAVKDGLLRRVAYGKLEVTEAGLNFIGRASDE